MGRKKRHKDSFQHQLSSGGNTVNCNVNISSETDSCARKAVDMKRSCDSLASSSHRKHPSAEKTSSGRWRRKSQVGAASGKILLSSHDKEASFRGNSGRTWKQARHHDNNQRPTYKPRSSSVIAGSSAASDRPPPTATNTARGKIIDIPGFYYDSDKKKYFRILEGQHSANSTMVTRETIKVKRTEEARQRSLLEFALKTIKMNLSYGDTTYTAGRGSRGQSSWLHSNNILHQMDAVRHGAVALGSEHWIKRRIIRYSMQNLSTLGKQRIFADHSPSAYTRLEHMAQMNAAPSDDSSEARVLCLWSLEGLIVQRIQQLLIRRVERQGEDGQGELEAVPTGSQLLQSISKVTHMCWAPATTGSDQRANTRILFTTSCFIGNSPSLAMLRTLGGAASCPAAPSSSVHQSRSSCPVSSSSSSTSASPSHSEFHLGSKTTWACAWNTPRQAFSIGSEENALVIDVATRRMWELDTRKSGVYTQTFSNTDGNMLYSGTRRGQVLLHDMRSMSTRCVASLNHKSPVCHVHLLQSERHLLASDFSGRLCQWDLRMRQVVKEYAGHHNEYTRIPFTVDQSESVLCAVGQDCYTRLWDLETGEQLNSVPPPYAAARDLIPSVAISCSPRGRLDRPGLLLGIKDELHFYAT